MKEFQQRHLNKGSPEGDGNEAYTEKTKSNQRFMKDVNPIDTCLSPEEKEDAKKKNKDIMRHNRSVEKKMLHDKLLEAHGVQIVDCGSSNDMGYDEFFKLALADVKSRIEDNRNNDNSK